MKILFFIFEKMGGVIWTRTFLFCLSLCFIKGQSFSVKVYPSVQKVAENSPAIFTCVSSESDGEFTWYRIGKPVDEERDEVNIRMLDDHMSVLKVERADMKKHKKMFKCRFTNIYGVYEEETIDLRILPTSRLHKYFPLITPIRTAEDVMQEAPAGQMKLTCSVNIKKNLPTWRWIKDGYHDLMLSEDVTEGRITVSADGELMIRDVTVEDSGMYMCVAENNRGTAYSTQFRVAIVQDSSRLTGCMDESGYRSNVGETYKLSDDICTTCSCEEGGSLRCRSISCYPGCPMGQRPKMSEDECCVYECLPETALGRENSDEEDQCRDKDGKVIYDGEIFSPDHTDPCKTCLCEDGQERACRMIKCSPPSCVGYKLVPGTCCEFTCPGQAIHAVDSTCTDRDGRSVMAGDMYMPEEDPCLKCECNNGHKGRCMMVACKAPHCPNFIPSRDECCNYTCLDVPPLPGNIKDGCSNFNGRTVRYGEMYQPRKDPCYMCECAQSGRGECHTVTCDEPTCRDYILIPGTCCGFKCPDDEDIETVSVNLDDVCQAYNGSAVPSGALYHPTRDPCYRCTCLQGEPRACTKMEMCPEGGLPIPSHSTGKVLGRMVMQQTGRNDAIVQWSVPEAHEEEPAKFTVHYHDLSTHMHRSIPVNEETYLILRDLELNTMYDVHVNGTVGTMSFSTIPMPYRFSLQGRGHSSLALNNALGQVFMSRGSISYDGYSLPREFEPVARDKDVDVLLNVRSFHMVEISTYNEAPCPDQDCGLIRFYMYGVDGESQNIVSLMFASQQDFMWAKAHL